MLASLLLNPVGRKAGTDSPLGNSLHAISVHLWYVRFTIYYLQSDCCGSSAPPSPYSLTHWPTLKKQGLHLNLNMWFTEHLHVNVFYSTFQFFLLLHILPLTWTISYETVEIAPITSSFGAAIILKSCRLRRSLLRHEMKGQAGREKHTANV